MARIVVVEDDPVSARVVDRVLTRMGGHEVTISEDGDEVLALCATGRVDLLVMDISLANTTVEGDAVDGVRLTQLIRDRSPQYLPVLLVTAHAMQGDRTCLLQSTGADAYLAKPIVDHPALVALVDDLLRGSEAGIVAAGGE
ncbi:MAG: response regulator [candidate division WS1 bacterium]|nr:response regulator [candidate division WS1 bacterium]